MSRNKRSPRCNQGAPQHQQKPSDGWRHVSDYRQKLQREQALIDRDAELMQRMMKRGGGNKEQGATAEDDADAASMHFAARLAIGMRTMPDGVEVHNDVPVQADPDVRTALELLFGDMGPSLAAIKIQRAFRAWRHRKLLEREKQLQRAREEAAAALRRKKEQAEALMRRRPHGAAVRAPRVHTTTISSQPTQPATVLQTAVQQQEGLPVAVADACLLQADIADKGQCSEQQQPEDEQDASFDLKLDAGDRGVDEDDGKLDEDDVQQLEDIDLQSTSRTLISHRQQQQQHQQQPQGQKAFGGQWQQQLDLAEQLQPARRTTPMDKLTHRARRLPLLPTQRPARLRSEDGAAGASGALLFSPRNGKASIVTLGFGSSSPRALARTTVDGTPGCLPIQYEGPFEWAKGREWGGQHRQVTHSGARSEWKSESVAGRSGHSTDGMTRLGTASLAAASGMAGTNTPGGAFACHAASRAGGNIARMSAGGMGGFPSTSSGNGHGLSHIGGMSNCHSTMQQQLHDSWSEVTQEQDFDHLPGDCGPADRQKEGGPWQQRQDAAAEMESVDNGKGQQQQQQQQAGYITAEDKAAGRDPQQDLGLQPGRERKPQLPCDDKATPAAAELQQWLCQSHEQQAQLQATQAGPHNVAGSMPRCSHDGSTMSSSPCSRYSQLANTAGQPANQVASVRKGRGHRSGFRTQHGPAQHGPAQHTAQARALHTFARGAVAERSLMTLAQQQGLISGLCKDGQSPLPYRYRQLHLHVPERELHELDRLESGQLEWEIEQELDWEMQQLPQQQPRPDPSPLPPRLRAVSLSSSVPRGCPPDVVDLGSPHLLPPSAASWIMPPLPCHTSPKASLSPHTAEPVLGPRSKSSQEMTGGSGTHSASHAEQGLTPAPTTQAALSFLSQSALPYLSCLYAARHSEGSLPSPLPALRGAARASGLGESPKAGMPPQLTSPKGIKKRRGSCASDLDSPQGPPRHSSLQLVPETKHTGLPEYAYDVRPTLLPHLVACPDVDDSHAPLSEEHVTGRMYEVSSPDRTPGSPQKPRHCMHTSGPLPMIRQEASGGSTTSSQPERLGHISIRSPALILHEGKHKEGKHKGWSLSDAGPCEESLDADARAVVPKDGFLPHSRPAGFSAAGLVGRQQLTMLSKVGIAHTTHASWPSSTGAARRKHSGVHEQVMPGRSTAAGQQKARHSSLTMFESAMQHPGLIAPAEEEAQARLTFSMADAVGHGSSRWTPRGGSLGGGQELQAEWSVSMFSKDSRPSTTNPYIMNLLQACRSRPGSIGTPCQGMGGKYLPAVTKLNIEADLESA